MAEIAPVTPSCIVYGVLGLIPSTELHFSSSSSSSSWLGEALLQPSDTPLPVRRAFRWTQQQLVHEPWRWLNISRAVPRFFVFLFVLIPFLNSRSAPSMWRVVSEEDQFLWACVCLSLYCVSVSSQAESWCCSSWFSRISVLGQVFDWWRASSELDGVELVRILNLGVLVCALSSFKRRRTVHFPPLYLSPLCLSNCYGGFGILSPETWWRTLPNSHILLFVRLLWTGVPICSSDTDRRKISICCCCFLSFAVQVFFAVTLASLFRVYHGRHASRIRRSERRFLFYQLLVREDLTQLAAHGHILLWGRSHC